jgi:hypothetical protein
MADSEASQLWFGEYGAKWIKEHGTFCSLTSLRLPVDSEFHD